MQVKSARGIQQEDVWAAADALVAEGLRPTIERVRLKIGRGSPNTVSPLLEAWFATLGPRLGAHDRQKERESELPLPVRQAAANLWGQALLFARDEAAQGIAKAERSLADANAALTVKEAGLQRQEQALAERQIAFDEALQSLRAQVLDLGGRLAEAQGLLGRRASELDELRAKLSTQEARRQAERQQNDEETRRYADERRRLEERAAASERRLLTELERERQLGEQSRAQAVAAEQRAQALQQSLEAANQEQGSRAQKAELELQALRQSLASAQALASELRGQLDSRRDTQASALEQINRALAESRRNTPRLPFSRRFGKR